jgi:hypothetical protein
MNRFLEFVRTHRVSIAWTVLILNLLAGIVALLDRNFYNVVFHFSLVLAVILDLTKSKL